MAVEPDKVYPQDIVRGTFFEHDLSIANMFVHFRTEPGGYARPLRPWRVNKLVSDFDRQALGVILLSMRANGSLAAIDGQHRIEAAKRLGITTLDALVFIDLSLEDEARLYRKFGDYLKQTPLDKYHAGVTERLPEYLAIQRILGNLGLHVPQVLGAGMHGIDAVDSLIKVATIYRPEGLQTALGLLQDAWNNEQRSYRAITIQGTAMFLARFQDNPNFNRKRLVARMARLGISTVERQAYIIRDANIAPNPNSGWGQALLQIHNKGMAPGQELGEWQRRLVSESVAAQSAANLQKSRAAMTPEERTAAAKKAAQTLGPDKLKEKAVRAGRTRHSSQPRDVPCPYCYSGVGYRCMTSDKQPANTYHQARINAWQASKAHVVS